MQRKKEIVVRAELLSPAPRTPKTDREALERLVAEKVQEILSDREDLSLQPFFNSRNVSHELRRLQTMPERRKWAIFFERHGCLICGTKQDRHSACGMCPTCYTRTAGRLSVILSERTRERVRRRFTGDLEAVAKRALLKALPAVPREVKP